jgi:predicted hydrocarbon binding protein
MNKNPRGQLPDFKPVLLKTLDKDPETGLIVESISGEKIVTFRTKTFLQLMDRLMGLLGGTIGATVINQMGIDVGRSTFGYMKDEVKSDNDLVSVMDIVLAERGWGRCRAIKKVEMRGLTYSIRTEGNPISGTHGKNEPMCHFIRGIYTGFLEAYLDKKAKHSEQVACAALGAPCCTFEIAFE